MNELAAVRCYMAVRCNIAAAFLRREFALEEKMI